MFAMWARKLRLRFGRFDGINSNVAITRQEKTSNCRGYVSLTYTPTEG